MNALIFWGVPVWAVTSEARDATEAKVLVRRMWYCVYVVVECGVVVWYEETEGQERRDI